jgi:F-type H+-transporting ATPase subunit b
MRPTRHEAAAWLLLAAILATGTAHADTMPQLDFGNKLLTAQVVWGALIFAVFYLLVSRWGLPQVAAVLDMRAGVIARDLDQARAARDEANRAVSDMRAARQKANAESQAAIAAATSRAKAEAAERAAEQEARLGKQLAESEAQIAAARVAALGALRQVATETASAIVSRLTPGPADEHRVQDEVGRALAERGLAA